MAETTRGAEQVMANIRKLNEQILEAGPFGGPRVPGRLRAKLRTFADYQGKLAECVAERLAHGDDEGPANSMRDVVNAVSEGSRGTLKKQRPSSGR